jgi:hypothetical protein
MRTLPNLLPLFLATGLAGPSSAQEAPPAPAPEKPAAASSGAEEPAVLRVRKPGALEGLTLVAPLNSGFVHLVDLDGEIVHSWVTEIAAGGSVRLLANGNLLHCGRKEGNPRFFGGGIGGLIRELDRDSNTVWEYELADAARTQHHDFIRLANGNLITIAWEYHSPEEALAAGRDPEQISDKGFWTDAVLEIRPTRPKGGEIVWEWHSWDHLVQDFDPARKNHGAIAEHPGRFDVNVDHREKSPLSPEEQRKQAELEKQMKALGYVGGDDGSEDGEPAEPAAQGAGEPKKEKPKGGDWLHTNSLALHPELDLLVLSSPHIDEIYVIDHSTTTKEAATSKGGRRGRGGELLYRWGNPRNYGAGKKEDQRLFGQHDVSWIAGEKPGELRVMLFNNGGGRPGKEFSSVDELVLPFDRERGFVREAGQAFGPKTAAWSYSDPADFYSPFISGAQRLSNGSTLVCEGKRGRVFEITRAGEIVWDWINPHGGDIPPSEQAGKAPPTALFRATRIAKDDPSLKAFAR